MGLELTELALDGGLIAHKADGSRADTTSLSILSPEQIKLLILAACQDKGYKILEVLVLINHRQTVDVFNNIISQTLAELKKSSFLVDSIVEIYIRATIVVSELGYQRKLADELTFADRKAIVSLSFKRRALTKASDALRSQIRLSAGTEKEKAIVMREQQLSFDRQLSDLEASGGILWEIYNVKPDEVVAVSRIGSICANRVSNSSRVAFAGKRDALQRAIDGDEEFFGFLTALYKAFCDNRELSLSYEKRKATGDLQPSEKQPESLTLQQLAKQVTPKGSEKANLPFSF
jgi:hypothetical protein